MLATDTELLGELERFTATFRAGFRRRDRERWAAAYLLGLLRAAGRKTAGGLARTLSVPAAWGVRDVGQALQHFLTQSPWDEEAVWQRRLELLAPRLPPGGLLVVGELTFPKQGRHSVGVQRQYSGALARKINCQIAVTLQYATADRFCPLLLRLYLPRTWLQDDDRLERASVPPARRPPASKVELALELLDRAGTAGVLAEGVAVVGSKGIEEELTRAATKRGLTVPRQPPPSIFESVVRGNRILQEELGLDHFEGRSWRGFHRHACLVMLAHSFRMQEILASGDLENYRTKP